MKKLDSQQILRDYKWKGSVILSSVFLLVGVTLSTMFLRPLFFRYTRESMFIAVFVLISFGGFLGLYLGLFRLWRILRRVRKIRQERYKVLIDVVASKEDLGYNPEHAVTGCYLTFVHYSQKTGKNVMVTPKQLEESKTGDEYYLVILDGEKQPLRIYNKKQYVYTSQTGR